MLDIRYLFIALIFLPSLLQGQTAGSSIGAAAMGMGYAASCIHNEWSLFNNIGGMSKIHTPTIASTYEAVPHFQPFNRAAISVAIPTKIGVYGLGLYRFGDNLYNEQTASLGFANKFGISSLGVRCNVIQYYAEGFGVSRAFTISFGGITELTETILIGAHILNINQPAITLDEEEKIPTVLTVGLGFILSPNLFTTLEVEKDLDYDPTIKTGLRYTVHKKLNGYLGFNLNPTAAFSGFEISGRKLALGYAYRMSFEMGSSHQASISVKMRKGK